MAIQRNTAYIMSVEEINNSSYVKTESQEESNYLDFDGEHINRVNVIGAVLSEPERMGETDNMRTTIDDGTGAIVLTSFNTPGIFDNISVGDAVLVIGRPREWNNGKYITPEIIKKLENTKWIEFRKLQLEKSGRKKSNSTDNEKAEEINEFNNKDNSNVSDKEEIKEEITIEEEDIDDDNIVPQDKVVEIIRKLDSGEGADIEDILKELGRDDGEQILQMMLREGEIFQVKPGKIKLL